MKCPLLKKRFDVEAGENYDEPLDCPKEECAWWSKAISACSVLGLEVSLSLIGALLLKIEEKMPHANQFTK